MHAMVVATHAEEHWFEVVMDGVFHLETELHNEGPLMLTSANSHTRGHTDTATAAADRRCSDRTKTGFVRA
jgi:hypothetical protein